MPDDERLEKKIGFDPLKLDIVDHHTADVLPEGTDFSTRASCGCYCYAEAVGPGHPRNKFYMICDAHKAAHPGLSEKEIGDLLDWKYEM